MRLAEHYDAVCVSDSVPLQSRLTFCGALSMPNGSASTITVLDHLDGISVPGNVFCEPVNEYWALMCLHDGMEFLYRQSLHCDQAARQQVNPHGNVSFVGWGNVPTLNQIPKTLLTCAFHWYAISACQYVRTVGAIAFRLDPNRPRPDVYAKNVIPEVVAFRDKVAAHFAWSTRNQRDNHAERIASILPPLTFVNDAFFVGGMTVAVRHAGEGSDSAAIKPWSLCRVHEALRKRYWPHEQRNGTSSLVEIAEQEDEGERA